VRCILTPVGSSGDVNPFVGIGRRLRERGYDVFLVAAEPFRETVEDEGLRFVPLGRTDDFHRLTEHPDLWHTRRGLKLIFGAVGALLREAYAQLEALHEPGRTIVIGHSLSFATRVFEEVHRVPAVTVHLSPNVFRSDFQLPALPSGADVSGAPRWVKRSLMWVADRFIIDPYIAPALNAWRTELGLRPVKRVFESWVHSPRRVVGLFPEWFGLPQPDWPPQVRLTGFPLYDAPAASDAELEAFLRAGEAPIVFTPGSANRQAAAFFEAAIAATARLGRRALLATGFPEHLPADLPSHVRHVAYAPFSRLLPRSAAIVHHGGIGTCAQGLAAGIPQLVMPLAFDQPDNALRLTRLGVGRFITPRRFTAPRVAPALGDLLSSDKVAAACRRYRDAVMAMDAVGRTCEIVERSSTSRVMSLES